MRQVKGGLRSEQDIPSRLSNCWEVMTSGVWTLLDGAEDALII